MSYVFHLWKRAGIPGTLAVIMLVVLATYVFSQQEPEREASGQAQRLPNLIVDSATAPTYYANYMRVTGTPEELVLDFSLNTQMNDRRPEPIKASHRLVMNYYTAKRLLGALQRAVQQHENAYGELELDVNKRARKR
jgi:hypothetical protein